MGRRRNVAKRELWQRRLREFDRDRKTVAEFCRGLGVSVATFYQWQRKLTPAAGGGSRKIVSVAARTSECRPAADAWCFGEWETDRREDLVEHPDVPLLRRFKSSSRLLSGNIGVLNIRIDRSHTRFTNDELPTSER